MAKCVFKVAVIALFFKILLSTKLGSAAQYRVGGLKGWEYGNDLEAWASSITFKQGDTLYFEYEAKMHSVLQVSEADYKACNTRAPITSDGGKGGLRVTLQEAGVTFFFICGLPAHCADGHMKLAIPVHPLNTQPPQHAASPSSAASPHSHSSASLLAPLPHLFLFFFVLLSLTN
ncbi:hypothetical protein L7F22_005351 [Adiantum nelumboides]|nr:hypothetical protein [Adiantum nelumboides]